MKVDFNLRLKLIKALIFIVCFKAALKYLLVSSVGI